jgi:carbon-monoxide dehydrogenase medium subunit
MDQNLNFFRPTEYLRPNNTREAVELLTQYGNVASPIAGGTDLLVKKDPKIKVLVDITSLGLNYIQSGSEGIAIGAGTTMAELGAAPSLRVGPYRMLAQAAQEVGTPQIRNMATLGGNLCRPSPAADTAPPLLALGALVRIAGAKGHRDLEMDQFFKGVNQDALQPGELVTEIRIPSPPERTGTAFIKKGRVTVGDLSIVSAAVCVTLDQEGICSKVRIALGAVAPTPLRAKQAESLLAGKAPQRNRLSQAAQKASEEIRPISDVRASAEYRRTLSRVLVERALDEALRGIV